MAITRFLRGGRLLEYFRYAGLRRRLRNHLVDTSDVSIQPFRKWKSDGPTRGKETAEATDALVFLEMLIRVPPRIPIRLPARATHGACAEVEIECYSSTFLHGRPAFARRSCHQFGLERRDIPIRFGL